GADLDAYAAAALGGIDIAGCLGELDRLTRVHLVQESGAGRYRMHDLLHAYAAERAGEDPEQARRDAVGRLLEYYTATAAAGMDIVSPADRHRRPKIDASALAAPPVDTEVGARAWLDTERGNLVAVTALATDHGWPAEACRLAGTVQGYLHLGGHFGDALT